MVRAMMGIVFMLAISMIGAVAHAMPPQNHSLSDIKYADIADRTSAEFKSDWKLLRSRDEERHRKVLDILREGDVRTNEDFEAAALVLQHGNSVDDFRLAFALATIAWTIDPTDFDAKRLSAKAWDRMLMRSGKPQWYGTQYVRSQETGLWQLYEVDAEAVSDKERSDMGVPALVEAKSRVEQLNAEVDPSVGWGGADSNSDRPMLRARGASWEQH